MLLEAVDLSFSYRRDRQPRAIDGVSLSVEAGSVVGVLGPNGSGKTTLIKLLSGALGTHDGDVTLDRVPLSQLSRTTIARRIAVVPQDTHLAFDYTALEIVLMGRYPRLGAFEIEGPDDIRCAMDALQSTGTRELATRPFTTLSGGERQRVIIASALAQLDERFSHGAPDREVRPILFMDEPTASLDLRYQIELAALLRRLNRERGITIVLSTHDLRLTSAICTTVVMLANGRVLATGAPDEVLTPSLVGTLYGVDEHLVARALACIVDSPLRRRLPIVALSFAGMVFAVLAAPFVGSTPLSVANVFSTSQPFADNVDAQIFFLARLPRTLAAAMVGGVLAAAGVVFQGLLQNPLASPYTLGVSSGAALGAMIAMSFGAAWPIGGSAGASLAGAGVAVLVVYALATARHRGLSTTVLLLSGVTLNAFFSALILFVQYLSNFADTYRALRWLMGNLDVAGYAPLLAALPLIIGSLAAFAWLARPLNLLSLGDEAATSRGLDTRRAQRVAFFSGSVATGAAVSVGGPIGFVGIIVPHLVRLVVGADHRIVLPVSTFFGAAFLVGCDTVARTVMAPLELPVGIITAVIGGPFFLWLLLRKR